MKLSSRTLPIGLAAILLVAMYGWRLFYRVTQEITEVRGDIYQPIRVDSEYGMFNGVFSPEIIYYTSLRNTGNAELDRAALLITEDTTVYVQRGDALESAPLNILNRAGRVHVSIGEIDRQPLHTNATAVRIVILEFR